MTWILASVPLWGLGGVFFISGVWNLGAAKSQDDVADFVICMCAAAVVLTLAAKLCA